MAQPTGGRSFEIHHRLIRTIPAGVRQERVLPLQQGTLPGEQATKTQPNRWGQTGDKNMRGGP